MDAAAPSEPPAAGLSLLGCAELSAVCATLSPAEAARLACADRSLAAAVLGDHPLWARHLREAWGEASPCGPDGVSRPSPARAYAAWASLFAPFGPLFPRVRAVVDAGRRRGAALGRGATPDELAGAATALGLPALPPSLACLWLLASPPPADEAVPLQAFIGGYAVYDHVVVTRLLGPAEAVAVTRQLRACGLLPPAPAAASVVVAASRSRGRVNKFFALDCGGGGGGGEALAVSRGGGRAAPAAPPGPHPLLRWLEAHAAAAEGGVFRAEALDPTAEAEAGAGSQAAPPPPRALTLFPRPHLPSPTSPAPHPLAARAVARVTRGVEVVASAVHLPEGSDGRRSAFGYRIRVRLLPLAAQGGGAQPPLASAQLLSRRWVVSHPAGSGAPDDAVEGPGVVGLTPLLLAGGPPFEYCSMTRVVRAPAPAAAGGGGGVGWMGGALVFVPGSGAHQAGEPFEAAVGPFPLEVGGYVW